jgi:hypothetical protein
MSAFTWEELCIVSAALAAGGTVKGLTGVGLPLVAVPLLAGFLGVEHAVLILIIPAVVLNAYQIVRHRDESAAMPEWPRMIVAGVPGAALGATVLHSASERFLSTALAIWIFAYIVFRALHPSFTLSLRARLRWSPGVGAAAGALQAATGISAPVVAAYADSLGLRPSAYVFAVSVPFCAFAVAHLAIVSVSGLYTPELFTESLFAVLPAIAAIPLGMALRSYISRRVFDVLIRLTLFSMAMRLLYTAWF